MKQKPQRVVAVAVVALILAVVVAVIAFANRTGPAIRSSAGGPTPTTQPSRSASSPTSKPGASVPVRPTRSVDPLTGRSYCQSIGLLVRWSHQAYGLDPRTKLVDGAIFSQRLDVAASAYRRLATQAGAIPQVRATAAAWTSLADAMTAARDVLLVAGQDVQSQIVIVQLAKMAKVTRAELPVATRGLKQTCGISPADLDVR